MRPYWIRVGSEPNDSCKKARQKVQTGDTQKHCHMLTEAETGVIQRPVKNSRELMITNTSWGETRKDSPSEPPETKLADTCKSDLELPELWENTFLIVV